MADTALDVDKSNVTMNDKSLSSTSAGYVANDSSASSSSSNSGQDTAAPSGGNSSSPETFEIPHDAKTLLISTKRPRRFLERSARELLAGGTEVIILSALGDAIPLCVQLLVALEDKKAATTTKIETTYNPYKVNYKPVGYTPGLRVYMKKHPEFKGSRISPGYVSFCDKPNSDLKEQYTSCYTTEIKEGFASVNAGDETLCVGGAGINGAFAKILDSSGQQVDKYKSLHESSNMAMVYVVGPKGVHFNSKEEFLDAVHATAVNLMTALCDFNGFVRREEQKSYAKISVCRICLFSGGNDLHPHANKSDVAEAILSGLNEAYRHGPAPRLNFTFDDDVFRKVWTETTGLRIFQNSGSSSTNFSSSTTSGGQGEEKNHTQNTQANGF